MDILIGHLIGDYFLQNDWMGLNKSKKDWICILHCLIYTLSIALCTCVYDWRLILIFFQHFIFDRDKNLTKKLFSNYHLKWCTEREKMWWTIFYDNAFHIITIWVLIKFF